MSASPHVLPKSRNGQKMGNWQMVDTMINDGLWCAFDACLMGLGTDRYASGSITRAEQDELAAQSNERAAAASAQAAALTGLLGIDPARFGIAWGAIGAALARMGRRVLMVDADPQACLTVHLGIDPETAEAFHETLQIDGVIMSKMDGDARGGAALSVKEVIGRPIAFASTGEKLTEFEQFHPDRMAGRILQMGDIVGLVEKAQQTFDMEAGKQLEEKVLGGGQFDLEDFLQATKQIQKMGPIEGLLKMIPGVKPKISWTLLSVISFPQNETSWSSIDRETSTAVTLPTCSAAESPAPGSTTSGSVASAVSGSSATPAASLPEGVALVVLRLASHQGDLQLDPVAVQEQAERNHRQALFSSRAGQPQDLSLVEQQSSAPEGIMGGVAGVLVAADVAAHQVRLFSIEDNEGLAQIDAASARRLDLGAEQLDPGHLPLEDVDRKSVV